MRAGPLTTAVLGALALLLSASCAAQVSTESSPPGPDFWVLTNLEAPFIQKDERGKLGGYLVELIQGILNQAGIQQQILAAPWERVIKEAHNKPNVLVFPLARTPDREADFHWLTPLTANVFRILSKEKLTVNPSGLNDLHRVLPIGVLEGDFRQKLLSANGVTDIRLFEDHASAVAQLLSGEIKSLFFSDAGLRFYCHALKQDCSSIKMVYRHATLLSYLALSKNSQSAQIDAITDAAKRFKQSDEFKELETRWVGEYQQQDLSRMA
ncbi:MAG: polar amino acid transport system substrate-binding protein [Paraglaciecola sp.]|jgi:polar amino acid transport system substrate-binding protein